MNIPNITRRFVLTVVSVVGIALLGEVCARIYVTAKYGYDWRVSIGDAIQKTRPGQDAHPSQTRDRSYTVFCPCSGREITFTVNEVSGRGPNWAMTQPAGTLLRMTAVGGSTTFGSESPDDATYPAFLESALRRRYDATIEVLNAGVPKRRIEEIIADLPSQVFPYNPKVVLYYEAFNNILNHYLTYRNAELAIERFHKESRLGQLMGRLYYRSVLYTFLLEKVQFHLARQHRGIIPDIPAFQKLLEQLVHQLRRHQIIPVFVLQMTGLPAAPEIQPLRLDDRHAIETAVLRASGFTQETFLSASRSWEFGGTIDLNVDRPWAKLWGYQTQIYGEVVRHTGKALGVQVIDPQPVFAAYDGTEPLFCDVIHLTDRGNKLLAEIIAQELDLSALITSRKIPRDAAGQGRSGR